MPDRHEPSRIAPGALAHVLGNWPGDGPRYQRLADAIVAAIDRGALAPGLGLPPERVVAAQLGVSRGTVVAAFDRLAATGVIDRRQGSGTWVAADLEGARPALATSPAGARAQGLTGRLFQPPGHVIDLGISLLPDPSGLPFDAFSVDARELARLAEGHGYHPLGLPALRVALAELHSSEGLRTAPGQIVVTNGAQHAIALAARVLLASGDVVAVESPTYPGAIDAFARAGARFVTFGSDSGGARPDEVARAVATHEPRLIYLVPSAHNPTGTVLPDSRRRALAGLAHESGPWLLEDESLRWAVFDRPSPPSPIATHGGGRVLTVGSFSKLFWGGLRVGWLRAPEPLVERIGRLKAAEDLGTSAVSQVIALGLVDRLDEIAAHRRRMLADGAGRLGDLLSEHLPEWSFRPPDGGLSLWVRLPSGSGDAFAQAALAQGVGVLPGSAACVDEAHLDHIRLSVALAPETTAEAVERLARAWAEYRRRSGAVTSAPSARG